MKTILNPAARAWRKSSYSDGGEDNCVEVSDGFPGVVPVRDSKNPAGGVLLFPAAAWSLEVGRHRRWSRPVLLSPGGSHRRLSAEKLAGWCAVEANAGSLTYGDGLSNPGEAADGDLFESRKGFGVYAKQI